MQNALGICFERGLGVEKNETQAIIHFRAADKKGHSKAKARLEKLEAAREDSEAKTESKSQSSTQQSLKVEATVITERELTVIKSVSKVSPETFEALATVSKDTLHAVAKFSPEALHTFSSARPATLRTLLEMGESAEQVEREFKEIQSNSHLQEYYNFFQRTVSAYIAGSLAVKSKMTKDERRTLPEKVVSMISNNIQLPVLHGTVTKIVEKLVAFGTKAATLGADRSRALEVNSLSICFPNLQNAGALLEALTRYLTLKQKNDILAKAQTTTPGRIKKYIEKAKKIVKWVIADDIDTPARAFAAKQADELVRYLMEKKATRALTSQDMPELVKAATKDKVTLSNPATVPVPAGQAAHSFFATSITSTQTIQFNPTLLTKTVTDLESKATDAHKIATEMKQKNTEIDSKLAEENAHIKKLEQKVEEQAAQQIQSVSTAAVLERAWAEERAKNALLEKQRREDKDREEKRIVEEAERHALTTQQIGKMQKEITLLKNDENAFKKFFREIGGEQNQLLSTADILERGFERVDAGNAKTHVIASSLAILEEDVEGLKDATTRLRETDKLRQKDIKFLKQEHESMKQELKNELEQKHDSIKQDLKKELEQKHDSMKQDLKKELEQEHDSMKQDMKKELEQKHDSMKQDLKKELEQERESMKQELKKELEQERESMKQELMKELEQELKKELRKESEQEPEQERESMKQQQSELQKAGVLFWRRKPKVSDQSTTTSGQKVSATEKIKPEAQSSCIIM